MKKANEVNPVDTGRMNGLWLDRLYLTAGVCFAYVFSEWVFIVTRPSFLDQAGWIGKGAVLLQSYLILGGISLTVALIPYLLTIRLNARLQAAGLKASGAVPALILAGLGLLLIDNFTYTVFKFGVVTSRGMFRGVYGLLFLALAAAAYRWVSRRAVRVGGERLKLAAVALTGLGAVAMAFGLQRSAAAGALEVGRIEKRPNILLIGSDGVNASRMSAYGYERETTPNIAAFAAEGLRVENHFTNASNTSGSIISILTGRYPTQTRVLYPPDILHGADAYRHLPGMLKRWGYYNVELAAPHFADAYTLGLLRGFDEVNGRKARNNPYIRLVDLGFSNNLAYFLATLYERLKPRLLHIFYIMKMTNPYDLVTQNANHIPDQTKTAEVLRLLEKHIGRPVFIHAHLMGTHGPTFKPAVKKFSANKEQAGRWDPDYYDDAIYNFDLLFGKLIEELKARDLLEDTLIILYSDHGMGFSSVQRIPLVVRFPGGEHRGRMVGVGQNLDIAPTILEYLGAGQPAWMMGESLLRRGGERIPVISTGASNTENVSGKGWVQNELHNNPPFYQFDYIQVVDCGRWRRLDLETDEWTSGEVQGYLGSCSEAERLPFEQIQELITARLGEDGFSLPTGFASAGLP